ncbi:MAG TPA: alpha/beta fold hydrolase [Solirubrobacteraceae bacterium]|nr:alpha/beta fold hydrolase [Solirubrobacteraceae bacterium]
MLETGEHELTLHGNRVRYLSAGSGPPVLLIHGITSSADTWAAAISGLARRHTVIAPDLLGHGGSAKPRGDYSLGAYASGVRDLLAALGHDQVSVVGHSLGGGVAMQFAYQFPERTERLALISSGGLGREVNLLLRAAALPGAELVLPLLVPGWLGRAVGGAGWAGARLGLRARPDLGEVVRGFLSLNDAEARAAFLHTLRAVIDSGGQRVSGHDRLYLAANLPTLLVWGERDPIIPVAHAHAAHAAMPGSRLELFEDSGHFPHMDDTVRFVAVMRDFLETTEPAKLDPETLRSRILEGAPLAA